MDSACEDINYAVRAAISRMKHWEYAFEALGAGPALITAVAEARRKLEDVVAKHGVQTSAQPRPPLKLEPTEPA